MTGQSGLEITNFISKPDVSSQFQGSPMIHEDYQKIVVEARHRWLLPVEICEILENHERLTISQKPAEMPKSGSLFFYDRKKVRFRKDGYRWKKSKAGKTVKEGHENLRCNGVVALNCYYAHAEENENFHRRSYWMLKEDLSRIVLVHYREVKAMVHERDDQMRKHHRPTECSSGIQKKVILDCRQEGSGLHGSNPQPSMQCMQDSSSKDDPNLLKDELTWEMLENALARVKSRVQYPQQREQYRQLLNVITEILETKVACDNALNGPEGTTNIYDDVKEIKPLLDADNLVPRETSKVVSDNVLNGPEGTTNFYDELKRCLDLDADTFLPTETSKVVSDNVLNGPEGTTNFYDELNRYLDLDADFFVPTETSKVVYDNVLNDPEGTTNSYGGFKDLEPLWKLHEDNYVPTETSKIFLKQGNPVPPIVPDWINYDSPFAQGYTDDDDLMSYYHISGLSP